jgi:O-antigen ligase
VLPALAIPGLTARVASLAGVAGLLGPSRVEPDGPIRGRTTEMLAALAAYTDHPVLGVGPGQYATYHSVRYQGLPEISFREIPLPRRAHSLYLEIAAETGTVGLVIFMAIPLLLLMDLGRHRRALFAARPDLARLAAGFTLMLLAYLGTGVFLHLAYERYYWVMIAMAAAAVGALEHATLQRVRTFDPIEDSEWT